MAAHLLVQPPEPPAVPVHSVIHLGVLARDQFAVIAANGFDRGAAQILFYEQCVAGFEYICGLDQAESDWIIRSDLVAKAPEKVNLSEHVAKAPATPEKGEPTDLVDTPQRLV